MKKLDIQVRPSGTWYLAIAISIILMKTNHSIT